MEAILSHDMDVRSHTAATGTNLGQEMGPRQGKGRMWRASAGMQGTSLLHILTGGQLKRKRKIESV